MGSQFRVMNAAHGMTTIGVSVIAFCEGRIASGLDFRQPR
jgi:hypothetical protein